MNTNVVIGVIVAAIIIIGGVLLLSNRAVAPEPVVEPDGTAEIVVEEEPTLEDDMNSVTPSPTPVTSAMPTTSPASSPAQGAVKTFTVDASNFKFSPSTMMVKQGDTVRITITNDSPMPHDLMIDELSAASGTVPPGKTGTVEFVANKKGTFEYYCSIGNHRAMGMKGMLTVE